MSPPSASRRDRAQSLWSLWRLVRRQRVGAAVRPMLVWLLASAPALLVVYV